MGKKRDGVPRRPKPKESAYARKQRIKLEAERARADDDVVVENPAPQSVIVMPPVPAPPVEEQKPWLRGVVGVYTFNCHTCHVKLTEQKGSAFLNGELLRHSRKFLKEGASVWVRVVEHVDKHNMQIVAIQPDVGKPPVETQEVRGLTAQQRADVTDWRPATVRNVVPEKYHAFLTLENGSDVYAPAYVLKRAELWPLRQGEPLLVKLNENYQPRPRVVEVKQVSA